MRKRPKQKSQVRSDKNNPDADDTPIVFDADKPFLAQLEEMALYDDRADDLLMKIYQNPEMFMLLESFRLPNEE